MSHVADELTAYVDGALSPADRARVLEHLESCEACRGERDRIAAAVALLARLPPAPEPSPSFEQRFHARLAAAKAEGRERDGEGVAVRARRVAWRWLGPGFAGVAAAAAILLFVGARDRAHERSLAEHLDLLESYEAVVSTDAIDDPDDVQVVAHLDALLDPSRPAGGRP